jgi:hypothetical protein
MKITSKQPIGSKMIHIRLPNESHKKLRKLVIDKDTTMQDWVAKLVESKLQRESG